MARRSVVMDGELRYFEISVPGVEVLLNGGKVTHVRSHYVGDFADANIYKPTRDRTLEGLSRLVGADVLSEIRHGSGRDV